MTAETEPQPQPEPQPEPAPRGTTALTSATGSVATTRPATDEPQDTIVLAEIDTRVLDQRCDSARAAVGQHRRSAPSAQPLPPPFGTLYQFDAEGRIIPTAEGIITPEGVLLVAGKPAARATGTARAARRRRRHHYARAATAAAAEAAPRDRVTRNRSFADPALAGARPRVRPEGLAPVPQTADDDAALSDAQPVQVVSLNPANARPSCSRVARRARRPHRRSLGCRGRPPRPRWSPALTTRAAEALWPSPFRASPRRARPRWTGPSRPPCSWLPPTPRSSPRRRPRFWPSLHRPLRPPRSEPPPAAIALAPAVAAKPAKPRTSAPDEPAPTAFSKNEPDETERAEIDEPDSGGTAASTATRSVVAKQATFRNALNMSQVSLIGVFGSPSNRYAMVRQPGGRFVKVSVATASTAARLRRSRSAN